MRTIFGTLVICSLAFTLHSQNEVLDGYMPKGQFFLQNEPEIPAMEVHLIDQLYRFEHPSGEVRLVVSGSGGATDFGPYRQAYFIFDNLVELPWYYAIVDLGYFGYIEGVQLIGDNLLEIDAELYNRPDDDECTACTTVRLQIDFSEVIRQLETMSEDEFEGMIDSKVKVELFTTED